MLTVPVGAGREGIEPEGIRRLASFGDFIWWWECAEGCLKAFPFDGVEEVRGRRNGA